MANIINGTDTGSGGLITTGDSSDELQLQTAETARVTLTNTAVVVNEDGNDVDFRVEGDTDANLLFVDASTDRVGMGTNTPSSILHVSQDAPLISATSTNNSSGLRFNVEGTATTTYRFQYGGNTQATIDSSGNLGLGVTPSAWTNGRIALQIGGSTVAGLGFAGAISETYTNAYVNSGVYKYYTTGPAGLADFNNASAGGFSWRIAPSGTAGNAITFTQAMTLDASGKLLLAKTGTSFTVGDGYVFGEDGQAGVTSGYTTNAASTWRVYSTGAGAYRFFVGYDGVVNATNATISAISDQRLKENIRDLDVGLAEIMQLQPRVFDWKEGKGKDIQNDRGFIAQEFEQVFPNLIDEWIDPAPEGEEPYKSVRQDLIPVLVKAIQEQQAIIESLKSRLDAAGL